VTVPIEDLNSSAPQVAIKKISQWESPSRVLVAEMMILAGEVVGALGTAAALPLPYRGQAAPELPPEEELAELPEGPCKGYRLRR
jgi:exoribonuclease-2